jgi:hypothetical protein
MKLRIKLVCFIPFLLLAMLVGSLRYLWCILVASDHGINIAKGVDELANASLNGHPNETISSRAGRARRKGRIWGCVLCGLLDRIDPNHCEDALDSRFLTQFPVDPHS